MIEKRRPKNRIEFLELIDRMYERKYENVNINIRYDGLEVEYDLNDSALMEIIKHASFHILNFTLPNKQVNHRRSKELMRVDVYDNLIQVIVKSM
jgi:phosphatidylserine/phosphatidylglycerophosphate/cardiolipin synthase-like enzyme